MWLAILTRCPDISNAVRSLARYTSGSKIIHWKAALGILAYINGTSVFFCHCLSERDISRYSISLEVFADPDYASTATYRRSSVSGGPVMCRGECVCWLSRTQKCVTRSTSEAEYVALEDNQGALQLSKNPVSNSN